MYIKNQHGFAHTVVLVIVVALAVIFGTGWFVWHARQLSDQAKIGHGNDIVHAGGVTTYDECITEAGSKMLETYPQICVTSDGKRFTQPTNNSASNTNGQKYLVIKEWNIKIPLSSSTLDAYYSKDADGMMYISTKKLHALAQQVGGCHPGLDDIYLARTTAVGDVTTSWHVKIGDYEYFRGHVIEPQCLTRTQENLAKQYEPIQKSLENDLQHLVVE